MVIFIETALEMVNVNYIYMNEMQPFKLIQLNPIETEGKPGKLTEVNLKHICKEYNLEFTLYKCFYVNELNSPESRGNHSNNNVSEILICLQGSFEIKLHDGKKETIIILNGRTHKIRFHIIILIIVLLWL